MQAINNTILSFYPLAHFLPSNSSPGYKLEANGYHEMTHAASSPVMCHVNVIITQPKPVGCSITLASKTSRATFSFLYPPKQNSGLATRDNIM